MVAQEADDYDETGWGDFLAIMESEVDDDNEELDLFTLINRMHDAFEAGRGDYDDVDEVSDEVRAEREDQQDRRAQRIGRQVIMARVVRKALEGQMVPTHWRLVHHIVCDIAPDLKAGAQEVYNTLSMTKSLFRPSSPGSGVYELLQPD